MILGIGSDLLDMRRIEAIIERQKQRFLDRIFTPHEQSRASSRSNPMQNYAKIFAAKEAVAKALGTGIAKGVTWHDIEIRRDPWSAPYAVLTGMALELLTQKIPAGFKSTIHLSITDESPYCQAFVVISFVCEGT